MLPSITSTSNQSIIFHYRRVSVKLALGFLRRLTTAALSTSAAALPLTMETRIVKVPNKGQLGRFHGGEGLARLEQWNVEPSDGEAKSALEEAASRLRNKDTPVAFPTETVYGLGADATRSKAVKGIYKAKGRPTDNPLIVHVCDLQMVRDLLGADGTDEQGQIPSIYHPLIDRFWPGPLTILLPLPQPPKLAPEVTAGLPTFGVRMPSSPLALSLIKLTGKPLAGPSANASTKPSPTMAHHVKHDLDGRIELILDGGPCSVGVESTVVDGLCDPPAVLRPGGLSMDEIRRCLGWEHAVKIYKDSSEEGEAAPRAPGMKYKHYSPAARVVLYESSDSLDADSMEPHDLESITHASLTGGTNQADPPNRKIGVIRTQRWKPGAGLRCDDLHLLVSKTVEGISEDDVSIQVYTGKLDNGKGEVVGELLDINLGKDTRGIAQGLFSALRELDRLGADTIFVDGIKDKVDIAAAVMNRLRKAASERRA